MYPVLRDIQLACPTEHTVCVSLNPRSVPLQCGISSGDTGQGYFRALLPLADLLNHGGDEYSASPGSPMFPPASCGDNIAWSALDGDERVVEFAATRAIAAGEEALMSYGERSNDHFLVYYGFVPARNPHDDAVVFSDLDHALAWHSVTHPGLWGGDEEEVKAREAAARAAVKEVEKGLAGSQDADLAAKEPRLKVRQCKLDPSLKAT